MRRLTALLLASAAFAQDMLAEGERRMEAEDYTGAADAYTKAIEGAPGDVRGYAGRGYALAQLGKHEAAVKDYSKAIELAAAPDAMLHVRRAFCLELLGDYDAAIVDCGSAIALAQASAGNTRIETLAHRVRADAFHAKHEDAAALMDYDKALELWPGDETTLQRRGEARQALGKFNGALEDFDRLAELDPESPVPLALLGRTLMLLGNYASALETFDVAFKNGGADGDPTLRASCARARWALGQKEAADAEAAKAAAPSAPPGAVAEAGRYYFDTGRAKEAAAALRRAVDADPRGQDYARFYLFLARSRLGERALAAGELKRYIDGRGIRDDWYGKVASFLYGHLTEDQLLADASSKNPQLANEQECEAAWYAGAVRLLDGDATGAKALFERCVATDVRTFIEYESAKAALAAMK